MHTLISTDLSELAAQRRAVVFAVSRQVPEADPELATSSGLEQLCREIAVHGAVDRPVDYWHHAAIDAATEASATERTATATDAVVRERATRPAERAAEGPARSELPPSIEPAGRAADLPSTARRGQRPAGSRPAPELANVTPLGPAGCRITRGAMHDYIRHRLLPGRRRELEDHLVDCGECARAFTDVRESYWLQQAAPLVLRLGTVSVPGARTVAEAAAR